MKRRLIGIVLAVSLLFGGIAWGVQAVRVMPMTYAILSTNVTVSTSAVALPSTAMKGRETVAIFNNDATVVLYVGHSSVSSTNGFPIQPKATITIDADDSVVVYGIAASSINVRVLECK